MKTSGLFSKLIEPKFKIEKSRQRFSNRDLFRLIVPILVEQLLAMLVGIADTLMVSYAGEAAVSGVSLVNQLNNVFIFVFGAIASGGAVVASQYIGREDRKDGRMAAGQLLMITLLISILATLLSIIFCRPILNGLFGRVEPDVMEAAVTYLILSALSFPTLAVYNSVSALFRSMSKTKSVMNVSILMNIRKVSAYMMGMEDFDGAAFSEAVDHITALEDGSLEFHFYDGRVERWQR